MQPLPSQLCAVVEAKTDNLSTVLYATLKNEANVLISKHSIRSMELEIVEDQSHR